jgi:hypothetical protein
VRFFPVNFNFDWTQQLGDHASDADNRKSSDPDESPKHFIDIDSYQSFVDSNHIIQNYDSIISVYSLSYVIEQGTLPWTIITTTDSLQAAFEREDYNKAVLIAADLGHYVADAHMPLHITKNYNGQYSNQYGVHSRYESNMIDRYSTQINYSSDSIAFIDNITDYVFNMIYVNFKYVDSVLIADAQAKAYAGNTNSDQYYQKLWEMSGDFTTRLFKDASKSLAELIITAWINAGSPNSLLGINDFIEKINSFQLYQNYPNPFNPVTQIGYSIPHSSYVSLKVYDLLGKEIIALVEDYRNAGSYNVKFNASGLSSGVYLYQLKADNFTETKKFVLLK